MERQDWLESSDPRRAAAAWRALLEDGSISENERVRFADWLRQSPVHAAEYLRLGAVDGALRHPDVFAGISLDELLAKARQEGVATLPVGATLAGAQRVEPRRRPLRTVAAVAAVIGVSLAGWMVFQLRTPAVIYTTAVGEQRSVVLSDGSLVNLNTRSSVAVRFDARAREVDLAEGGEALFRVQRDPARPFRVRSGSSVVQAIGTEFTVRNEHGRTAVAVLDGRVSVTEAGERVVLQGGQGITVTAAAPVDRARVTKIDREATLAWSARRLVFDDMPLEAAIAEFNRYNASQVRLEAPSLAEERITGVFNANDPHSFLEFLQGAAPVIVTVDAQGTTHVRARAH